jgi:hypothetical protein
MPDKNRYEFISFSQVPSNGKTQIWQCLSNNGGYALGVVKWYGAWRQYCFFPSGETIFNVGCLSDIQDFIRQLMEERRKK